MRGAIIINAYSTNADALYQPRRLKEEFERKGVAADIIHNDSFLTMIDGDRICCSCADYDFIVYLDKDKYTLRGLSKLGVPLFNSYYGIMACDDKMMTYYELAGSGVRIPKTMPGLLCYAPEERIKDETVERIESELSYPLVVKECYGSLGKGVHLISNRDELLDIMERLKCVEHLFQEYIGTSYGKDVRVIVIGNQVIGAMLRSSENDFRSNIGNGGKGLLFPVDDEIRDIALNVTRTLKLDYCGIDLLFGPDDTYYVCEVNSNAFFSTFEKVTGINVAKRYAEYILDSVRGK